MRSQNQTIIVLFFINTLFQIGVANAQINFPDEAFRSTLSLNYNIAFDDSHNIINQSVADTITYLNLNFKNISDFTGIGAFQNLEILKCGFNPIKNPLNLSGNKNLKSLSCVSSNLIFLDLSENTELVHLECTFNNLKALDVSSNSKLEELICNVNQLDSLDLTKNTKLIEVNCSTNKLEALRFKTSSGLIKLNCTENYLFDLDLSNLTNLENLSCSNNKLTKLNLLSNFNLKYLYCPVNQLEKLDLTSNHKLVTVDCAGNKLSILWLGGSFNLKYIYCDQNLLTNLDFSEAVSLNEITCSGNKLISLNIAQNKNLNYLNCNNNDLSVIDFSGNNSLKYLYLEKNQITNLDLSLNNELQFLSCSSNKISTLNITGCTELTELNCMLNTLTALDISTNKKLKNIAIGFNPNLTKCFVWVLPFPPSGSGITINTVNSPVQFLLGKTAKRTNFQMFVERVNSLSANLKTAVVDSFMSKIPSFPYIEADTIVTFIHRGTANTVNVPSDANNFTESALPMEKISGTDLWFITQTYERDARLDYKFLINGSNWILDPKNPNVMPSGLGNNSELRMPDYLHAPEIVFDSKIPHGIVTNKNISSAFLGNTRNVKIYLPPSYTAAVSDSFPLVIFHDGLEYISLALANNTIDYLIYNKKIDPIIGVFIPPVARQDEYVGNKKDLYVKFISEEIVPQIMTQYRIKNGSKNRASIGISNGADISQLIGLKLSDKIGNIGCFSAGGNWHTTEYFNSPKLDLKFYMDAGTYDLPNFLSNNSQFVDLILKNKGYEHQFNIYHEGHSWGNWRAHLDNALIYFFPYTGSITSVDLKKNKEKEFNTLRNYPNPFNPSTTLKYTLNKNSHVLIKVFNCLGQEVKTLVNSFENTGENQALFESGNMATGEYWAVIWIDNIQKNSIKMTLIK